MQGECDTVVIGLKRKAVYKHAVPTQTTLDGADAHLTLITATAVCVTVIETETDFFCRQDSHSYLGLLRGDLTVNVKHLFLGQ